MKNAFKVVAVAVALSFSFAACNSNKSAGSTDSTSTSTTKVDSTIVSKPGTTKKVIIDTVKKIDTAKKGKM